ncbi:acyl-CoA dehydrogenase family protein [Actinocrispum wychmicini]|uniref:Acyl-CoA dehydrogenase n=1 Tax=Actinocrispum wychmicini TaxID=1213861 RepID=A0A4R2JUY7_9PSEU|nr:acyl-CoA dehydrogenase family protein [Actinocrispum wychmicini]TCO60859.1 acyl-CoA dehydrogenase [Actinocrispum wychmicini]
MRVTLSEVQRDVRDRFADLFDDDLGPCIRRMAELPARGSTDPGGTDAESAAVRDAVWRAMVDLGATRLLLPEKAGGEDARQAGAVMLCELLGAALYQGPLLDTYIAQEVLLRTLDTDADRIAETATGAPIAVAVRETATDALHRPGPALGTGDTLDGVRRFVGSVPESQYLLVVADDPAGVRCALVADGYQARRYDEVGRSQLFEVRFTGAPVVSWHLEDRDGWMQLVARARIRYAAYIIGSAQGALDLAVARSQERHQFGRPIGTFQAPAFRLAELAARIEATRWFVRAAAAEADTGSDSRLRAAQALSMAADVYGTTVLVAMQVHGAYGLTEDADIQLYYRRALIDRVWLGSPVEVRREVFPLLRDR